MVLYPKAEVTTGKAVSPKGNGLMNFTVQTKLIGPLWAPSRFKGVIEEARLPTLRYGKKIIQEKTPVKTGHLRSRWNYRGYVIQNLTYYGLFVEYGTIFFDGYFMATESADDISKFFMDEIQKGLRNRFSATG